MKIDCTAHKPTKKIAYDTVLKLKTDRRQVSEKEIDELLLYFAPSLPKIAKTAEQWVAGACGKNNVTYWKNYLYSKNGYLYGTDGPRAHRVRTELPEGFYDPATLLPSDVDARFPDIERVFREPTEKCEYVNLRDLERRASGKLTYLELNDTHAIDEKLILSATNRSLNSTVTVSSNGRQVWGASEFGDFTVMSMMSKVKR